MLTHEKTGPNSQQVADGLQFDTTAAYCKGDNIQFSIGAYSGDDPTKPFHSETVS